MLKKQKQYKLTAPIDYWYATDEEVDAVANGCGSITTTFVPDTIFGLDVKEACEIHDWMYVYGSTSRKHADNAFLKNLNVLNNKSTQNNLVRLSRKPFLYLYYVAVRLFGKNRASSHLVSSKLRNQIIKEA